MNARAIAFFCGLISLPILTNPALSAEVYYECAGGTRLAATFSPPGISPGNVAIVIGDSQSKISLPQVMSADGGRYANGQMEFWITGSGATFTHSGNSQKCHTK